MRLAALTLTVMGLVVPVSGPDVGERTSHELLAESAAAVQEMGRAQLPDSLSVTVCCGGLGAVKARGLVGEMLSWQGGAGCPTLSETENTWGLPWAWAPALSVAVMVTCAV